MKLLISLCSLFKYHLCYAINFWEARRGKTNKRQMCHICCAHFFYYFQLKTDFFLLFSTKKKQQIALVIKKTVLAVVITVTIAVVVIVTTVIMQVIWILSMIASRGTWGTYKLNAYIGWFPCTDCNFVISVPSLLVEVSCCSRMALWRMNTLDGTI